MSSKKQAKEPSSVSSLWPNSPTGHRLQQAVRRPLFWRQVSSSYGLLADRSLGFSDTWQLVINTGTTIVTFMMVF